MVSLHLIVSRAHFHCCRVHFHLANTRTQIFVGFTTFVFRLWFFGNDQDNFLNLANLHKLQFILRFSILKAVILVDYRFCCRPLADAVIRARGLEFFSGLLI